MSGSKVSLTLVIPTYNEEERLPSTLRILADWIPQSCFDVEVIIVDDGSRDKTREVAENYRSKIPRLRFLEIPHRGYMNAIITGLRASDRPWRATLEADCPVHPRVLESFLRNYFDFDIIMGSRVLRNETSSVENKPFFRRVLSFGMTRLFSLLFRGGIRDPQIGFKMYREEIVENILPLLTLRHDGLKTTEIVVKAMALGFRVKEVPVSYQHDDNSRCVPRGNYRVALEAALALFTLWAKSYVEYRRGDLPVCPVRFGFLLSPFWRWLHFPPFPTRTPGAPAASLTGAS